MATPAKRANWIILFELTTASYRWGASTQRASGRGNQASGPPAGRWGIGRQAPPRTGNAWCGPCRTSFSQTDVRIQPWLAPHAAGRGSDGGWKHEHIQRSVRIAVRPRLISSRNPVIFSRQKWCRLRLLELGSAGMPEKRSYFRHSRAMRLAQPDVVSMRRQLRETTKRLGLFVGSPFDWVEYKCISYSGTPCCLNLCLCQENVH